jgi:protein O-GlcNAc transferase
MITQDTIHNEVQTLLNTYSQEHANDIVAYLNALTMPLLEAIKDDAVNAYICIAENLIQKQEYHPDVSVYITKALELEPEHTRAFDILKLNYVYKSNKNNDMQQNIADLKQLLVYQPHDYLLQYVIGMTYKNLNECNDAISHFKLTVSIIDKLYTYERDKHDANNLINYKSGALYTIAQIYYKLNNVYLSRYYALKAYESNPYDADVNNIMGVLYIHMREIDKAIQHFERIPDEQKTDAIYTNLGSAYCYKINYAKAIEYYDKIPNNLQAFQNKLFTSHYILDTISDDMYMYELHKQINRFWYDAKIKSPNEYARKPLGSKLKIGFVSGEFIYNNVRGVIMYFMHSILQLFDRNKFDIICYSIQPITQVQKMFPDVAWRHTHDGIHTQDLKNIIHSDGIDILFDMAGHTSADRLDVFAIRAAPIQISYCAYPNTSGLWNMDYHIVDKYCDSDGISPGPGGVIRPSTQRYYTEKLIFMDKCFLNYTPYVDGPLFLAEQACIRNQYLTIGTFNKLNKINSHVVDLWQTILQKSHNTRFIIKTKDLASDALRNNFMQMFSDKNVHDRISILSYSPTNTSHLLEYNNIDIALDTFPYSGTCTTCDALYMGVPVITLFDEKRQYHVQNVSSSILMNAGLSEFVCFSEEEYINKIIYYANNLKELHDIKNKIRDQFMTTVCDGHAFVHEFEQKMIDTYHNHTWS